MKKQISIFLVLFLCACAPESKPGLLRDSGEDGGNDESSADAVAFAKLCQDATTFAAKSTIELILKKTGTTDCLQAGEKIVEEEVLDLSGQKIQDVKPIAVFKSLKSLYLSESELNADKADALASLDSLETLDLSGNRLERVPKLPPALVKADLSGNSIKKLDDELAKLPRLTHLSIRENSVTKVAALPLSLQALDIGFNPLEHGTAIVKACAKLKNLKEIYLTRPQAADRLKKAMPNLTTILDQALELE